MRRINSPWLWNNPRKASSVGAKTVMFELGDGMMPFVCDGDSELTAVVSRPRLGSLDAAEKKVSVHCAAAAR